MFIRTYQYVYDYLEKTQEVLEQNETANALMLGICLRLQQFPERVKIQPYFATVEDENGLIVAATMTPPFNIVLYGHRGDDDEALKMLASNLVQGQWPVRGVLGPARVADDFARIWTEVTGQMHHAGQRQRLFELDHVISPHPTPGKLRVAVESDVKSVTNMFQAFYDEAFPQGSVHEDAWEVAQTRVGDRDIFLWELSDGTAVSLAGKTRPVKKVISVGPVYTPPEYRGKGYASNCVAALSQLLLDSGWQYCSLFTDLANPTSNSIYQRIGYQPICDFSEYMFEQ